MAKAQKIKENENNKGNKIDINKKHKKKSIDSNIQKEQLRKQKVNKKDIKIKEDKGQKIYTNNLFLTFVVLLVVLLSFFYANNSNIKITDIQGNGYLKDAGSLVYFSGLGCPHCAKVSPVLFKEIVPSSNLLVIDYEVYEKRENAPLFAKYNEKYNSGLGIPLIIIDKKNHFAGDSDILEKSEYLKSLNNNTVPSLKYDLKIADFNFNTLEELPSIWYKNTILIKTKTTKSNISNDILHTLIDMDLTEQNIRKLFKNEKFKFIEPKDIDIGGNKVSFDSAIQFDGWIFEWRAGNKDEIINSNLIDLQNGENKNSSKEES